MSDRSLVGMSNSAKKRAARRDVDDRAILNVPRRSYLYAEARKRYRVGERLQICRWCKGGGGCKSIGAHLQWVNDSFRACDGSGVVRKIRARPCRGCDWCDERIRAALSVQRSEYDEPLEIDGPCHGSGVVVE